MKKLLAFLAVGIVSMQLQAVELVTNGGFETGNLTGWSTSGLTVAGSCGGGLSATDWNVSNLGTATNCTDPGNPVQGTYAVYNMFDAGAALTYRLWQPIQVPANTTNATLTWLDATVWTITGTQPRVVSVRILDSTRTNVLATLYSQNTAANTNGNTGWISHSANATGVLSALSGQSVVLEFSVAIAEAWTGPAGFGLDGVSLNVGVTPPVPALSWVSLLALLAGMAVMGAVWTRRSHRNFGAR